MSYFYKCNVNISSYPVNYTIAYSFFEKCEAEVGGGISCQVDRLVYIKSCCFSECSATNSGGGIYFKEGIANITNCCLYHCTSTWGNDFYLYTPTKMFTSNIQSTLGTTNGHAYYLSSRSTDSDSFLAKNHNITNAFVKDVADHYSTGLGFWLHKNTDFSFFIISNTSAGTDNGCVISFDNSQVFQGTFNHFIIVNNKCRALVSARVSNNPMVMNSCCIFNNNIVLLYNVETKISFNDCYFDFSETFLSNSETSNCQITHLTGFTLEYGSCHPYPLFHECSKLPISSQRNSLLFTYIFILSTINK